MIIQQSAGNPPPVSEDYKQRNEGPDQGLINAWLAGLAIGRDTPEVAAKALAGELPILPFRGGIEEAIKAKNKVGSLLYLAMWQGLRGEDLAVDTESEPNMTCTRTGVTVRYTLSTSKLIAASKAQ